ncbi:hypothetical protein MPER_13267 [Moniliophthora perniciosa FA553]|nr:hypothetical protein MPER_13267 [Moniliophthora perniciosa FA553]
MPILPPHFFQAFAKRFHRVQIDKPTQIYYLRVGTTNKYKVGRSYNGRKRNGQWNRKCFPIRYHWMGRKNVRLGNKTEALVHIVLQGIGLGRTKTPCTGVKCTTKHQEIFRLNPNTAQTVIEDAVNTVTELLDGRITLADVKAKIW